MLFARVTPVIGQLPAPPVVGDGPFQVGGYGSITFSLPEQPESASAVSELAAALLTWGQISPRTSYFAELDMAKRTAETWTGREYDRRFAPVRMCLEYTASDLLRFRVGRFLTPVGQWNEQHAEPLTWTPTRPLSTYLPFAKSLNGILVAGEGAAGRHDVGYALYWAPSLDLDGDVGAEESRYVNALGARVAGAVLPGLTVGLSAARIRRSRPVEAPDSTGTEGREEDKGGRALLGADLRWEAGRVDLSAEATFLAASERSPYEGGAFGIAAVRVYGPVWAVVRAETYDPLDGRSVRVGFTGVTVRAGPHLVAKAGRQFSQHPSIRIPDGWFVSFSSLF
jgi:hypothetical protein